MRAQHQDFQDETDTFSLTAVYIGDRLTLTLKDFTDWTIYQKKYTEDDIGGEINKRMGLQDVFSAFQQTKDRQVVNTIQMSNKRLKKYQFGTVVKNQGFPCYKIQSKGRITVYLNITDRRTKKEVTYESELSLEKLREMTQMEIMAGQEGIEKKSIFDELNKKIKIQSKEKEELSTKIAELTQKNQELSEKLLQTNRILTQTKEQFQRKINQIKRQIIQQTNKQQPTSQNQGQEEKFAQLMQLFELQNSLNLDKFAEMERSMKAIRFDQNLHSLPQDNSIHFEIDGLKVKYASPDAQTQYIFNMPIRPKESTQFKLKITHKSIYYLVVGIVDYTKQKDKRYSFDSGNAMCYWSNGQKYPQQVHEGEGFKQGDIVKVVVDRVMKTVDYIVNGVPQSTHSNEILGDSSRIFMPFVEMFYVGDTVEWVV